MADEHLAERRPAAEGPERVKAALRLFMEVCDAVNAAHPRGGVHRDRKPSNIRVDSRGEPRILDVGLWCRKSPQNDEVLSLSCREMLPPPLPQLPPLPAPFRALALTDCGVKWAAPFLGRPTVIWGRTAGAAARRD